MHASLLMFATILLTMAPPSGRPPVGPLERVEPRVYDLIYGVTLTTDVPYGLDDPTLKRGQKDERPVVPFGSQFHLVDTPIVMPVVLRSSYHRVEHETIGARLSLGMRGAFGPANRFRLEGGMPYHGNLIVIPLEEFSGKALRWQVTYRTTVFASELDEAAAARLPWPREWPEDVRDGLEPQLYIESKDEMFAATVERISGGNLRFVPPFLAAKDIIRYCITETNVSGDGVWRGRLGVIHGLKVTGARATALSGRGNPNDLVCLCVAMLRAAGIPARPVIGVMEDEQSRNTYKVWGEFYLHGAGWVPFDPGEMKGQAIQNRDIRTAWPDFGTLKDLNEWIPLAYNFMPPRAVESPFAPAVWGWDPRPERPPRAEQRIEISIVGRGRGIEDPQ